MSNLTVNTILDAATTKRLSTIEKHPLAFFIIILFFAVGVLSYLYLDLSKSFRDHLTNANRVMIEVLQQSNQTIKENTEAIKHIK